MTHQLRDGEGIKTRLTKPRTPEGLTPNQRLLLSHICQSHYLLWVGFQLLADDNLVSEQWKFYREHSRTHIDAILEEALKNSRSTAAK